MCACMCVGICRCASTAYWTASLLCLWNMCKIICIEDRLYVKIIVFCTSIYFTPQNYVKYLESILFERKIVWHRKLHIHLKLLSNMHNIQNVCLCVCYKVAHIFFEWVCAVQLCNVFRPVGTTNVLSRLHLYDPLMLES